MRNYVQGDGVGEIVLCTSDGKGILVALADSQEFDIRISAEDETRAQVYRVLASLFSQAPDAKLLKSVAALTGGPGAFGGAIGTLAKIAAASPAETVRAEYQDLFIGLGRGELLPYGSYYLTGFLQEKPLANLRRDMARLGITRSNATRDPEDHVASVLEMMAGLIDGRFGAPASLDTQKDFFDRHLGSWLSVFFRDLEAAKTSVLYSAVGSVGRAFLDIEAGAFEMV